MVFQITVNKSGVRSEIRRILKNFIIVEREFKNFTTISRWNNEKL